MFNDIFSSGWTDTVFAGRNQAYGAYQLRKLSDKAVLLACFISTALFTGAASYGLYRVQHQYKHVIPIMPDVTTGIILEKTFVVELPPAPAGPTEQQPTPPPTRLAPPIIVADPGEEIEAPPIQEPGNSAPEPLPSVGGNGLGEWNGAPGGTGTADVIDFQKPKTFHVVEQMPVFGEGENALIKYIVGNIHYPEIPKEHDVEGTVYVSFVVNEKGNVVDVDVMKGADRYLDKEAVRVIKSMPAWKPGRQNGEAVRVMFTVPIRFKLN